MDGKQSCKGLFFHTGEGFWFCFVFVFSKKGHLLRMLFVFHHEGGGGSVRQYPRGYLVLYVATRQGTVQKLEYPAESRLGDALPRHIP